MSELHSSLNIISQALSAKNKIPLVLPTNEAASVLNRRPQTLRAWACLENGPIRPIRINGRLAWRVSDIQSLLSDKVLTETDCTK